MKVLPAAILALAALLAFGARGQNPQPAYSPGAFRQADANSDGKLDTAEFNTLPEAIRAKAVDANGDGLYTEAEVFREWVPDFTQAFAAADSNRDGRLSAPELIDFPFVYYRAAMDLDGDGYLSAVELQTHPFGERAGLDLELIAALAFGEYDRNRDGQLDRGELAAAPARLRAVARDADGDGLIVLGELRPLWAADPGGYAAYEPVDKGVFGRDADPGGPLSTVLDLGPIRQVAAGGQFVARAYYEFDDLVPRPMVIEASGPPQGPGRIRFVQSRWSATPGLSAEIKPAAWMRMQAQLRALQRQSSREQVAKLTPKEIRQRTEMTYLCHPPMVAVAVWAAGGELQYPARVPCLSDPQSEVALVLQRALMSAFPECRPLKLIRQCAKVEGDREVAIQLLLATDDGLDGEGLPARLDPKGRISIGETAQANTPSQVRAELDQILGRLTPGKPVDRRNLFFSVDLYSGLGSSQVEVRGTAEYLPGIDEPWWTARYRATWKKTARGWTVVSGAISPFTPYAEATGAAAYRQAIRATRYRTR